MIEEINNAVENNFIGNIMNEFIKNIELIILKEFPIEWIFNKNFKRKIVHKTWWSKCYNSNYTNMVKVKMGVLEQMGNGWERILIKNILLTIKKFTMI